MSCISIFVAHDKSDLCGVLAIRKANSKVSLNCFWRRNLPEIFWPEFRGGNLEFVFTSFERESSASLRDDFWLVFHNETLDSSGPILTFDVSYQSYCSKLIKTHSVYYTVIEARVFHLLFLLKISFNIRIFSKRSSFQISAVDEGLLLVTNIVRESLSCPKCSHVSFLKRFGHMVS